MGEEELFGRHDVGAHGGEQEGRHFGVEGRAAGREGVCGRAGRRAYQQPVGLHRPKVVAGSIALQIRHVIAFPV